MRGLFPLHGKANEGTAAHDDADTDEGNEAEEQISIFVMRSARRSPLMVRPRLPP